MIDYEPEEDVPASGEIVYNGERDTDFWKLMTQIDSV